MAFRSERRIGGILGHRKGESPGPTAGGRFEQVLYRWTGVQAVDPAGRGAHFDGRKLAAIEKLYGEPWRTASGDPNPTHAGAPELQKVWNSIFDAMFARVLVQGPLSALFDQTAIDG